jgi:alpha-mannosidase
VNAPNVVISAIKKAESSDDLILRCYETDGQPTTAAIEFRYSGLRWSGRFHPYEIKTIRVNTMTRLMKEVNALEE